MKRSISIYIILFFITAITNCEAQNNNSSKQIIDQYSTVDFFKAQAKLFCWNGSLSSYKTRRGVAQIPLMSYNDIAIGQCRIISYPKAGLASWGAIIKPIRDLEPQHQEVRKISLDPKLQDKYDIYAFFVEAKNLVPFQDMGNPNAREPKFPCPVFVYKRESGKWALLKKVDIKDDSDYAELEFVTVVDKK